MLLELAYVGIGESRLPLRQTHPRCQWSVWLSDNFPRGHAGHREGRVADRARDTNPRMFAPAGGISMSMEDWGRFCIDQMRGSHGRGRLLKRQSYRLLHTPQGDTEFAALGWGVLPNAFGRRGPALFHSGSDGNWTAVVMLFCETGNGILVASNAFQDMKGDRAANEVMRAIVPLIAEAEPEASKPKP